MQKTLSGQLTPLNEEEAEELKKLKFGHVLEVTIVRKRNPMFHRKVMALFQTCFQIWREMAPRVEYHGQPVQPSFDRMRRDMVVLAGFYEPVFGLKGELRLEPKSISFANMEEDEFEALFSGLIDVALNKILAGSGGFDEKTLREHIDKLLSFS